MTTATHALGQRVQQLTEGYLAASPQSAGSLLVVVDAEQVRSRSRILQSKLAAVGISDVTQQGSLVLGGSVRIAPGLRQGVAGLPDLDLSASLDLDTLPEFFSYTTASSRVARSAARSRAALAQVAHGLGMRDLRMKKVPQLDVDEALMIGKSLTFQDGLEIIIGAGVKYLTMLAPLITVGKNVTVVWEQPTPADRGTAAPGIPGTSHVRNRVSAASAFHSSSGGNGGPGVDGHRGYPGEDAPTLEIWALDMTSMVAVHLPGVRGGTGQRGGRGGDGGDGAKGADSHASLVECVYGPGFGGDGGDGGPGGRGGRGGPGGRGGYLNLYLTDPSHDAVLAAGLSDNRGPGIGGDGGDGGPGGRKGLAGEAGDSKGLWCLAAPERVGVNGKDGADGKDGALGKDGPDGQLTAVVITEDDFRQTWTSPQLRRVSPSAVEVGDQITIDGANFSSTAIVTVAGVPATSTTVISDTLVQAKVPAVPSGWANVVVEEPSGKHSNPGSVQVLATLHKVSPNPAAIGDAITLVGKGFQPHSRVLFRGTELVPDEVTTDGKTITVTLPKPPGPFEDPGGVEDVAVRNPDGSTTGTVSLTLRQVLSSGFDVTKNGYRFENQKPLQALADLGTFEETYGVAEVSVEFWLDWKGTGAWYLFYLSFFNDVQPGYSSGFSTTAADEYWSGNPDLFSDYATLPERERFLTVAQGHVLGQEMLLLLAAQAAAGLARAETSLNEVEAAFREQLTLPSARRREIAPIIQLMPAGTLLSGGFIKKLGDSHGLLPIRIEYPVDGEDWERRLVVYDNASIPATESVIEFSRSSRGLEFELSPDDHARTSRNDWTLSQASLELNWLSDVTLPLDYVFLISSASLLITDDQGRRYGTAGGRAWTEIPDVTAAPIARNVYLLPLDRSLTFTVGGDTDGSYTLAVAAGSAGRSLVLKDVTMSAATRDVVTVDASLSQISVTSAEDKELTMSYGVVGRRRARGLTLSGLRVGTDEGVGIEVRDALAGFRLTQDGSDRTVAVELIAADDDTTVRRQRFDPIDVGGGPRAFRVGDWSHLGPDSLQPDPAG